MFSLASRRVQREVAFAEARFANRVTVVGGSETIQAAARRRRTHRRRWRFNGHTVCRRLCWADAERRHLCAPNACVLSSALAPYRTGDRRRGDNSLQPASAARGRLTRTPSRDGRVREARRTGGSTLAACRIQKRTTLSTEAPASGTATRQRRSPGLRLGPATIDQCRRASALVRPLPSSAPTPHYRDHREK